MENKNISIILSDLDGTLFHDDKSISDYSKNVIARAQQKGVLFGVCTSRARVNAINFLGGIKPDIFITNGGGMVTVAGGGEIIHQRAESVQGGAEVMHRGDEGMHRGATDSHNEATVYSCEFSVEEIRTLINATFEVCGADAILSVDNDHGLYCNTKDELGDKYWTYNDFSDFNEPAMKMCIETLDRDKVEKIASSLGCDKIDYLPFSDIPWYKLSKKGATKEKAIQALCEHLKISAEQIAAFGDDFNDIGMLKLCGKGIAMSNAIAEVKEIADEVCGSNEEDGVAKWIEEKIL